MHTPTRQRLRTILLFMLCAVPVATLAVAADRRNAASPPAQRALTGKERLSDKASDEQRVDDCKVAPGRRTKARPTSCPWDAGS